MAFKKRGLQVTSGCHLSDNGYVPIASQAAEVQSISCVPRSVIRMTVVYQNAAEKPTGSNVESGPRYHISSMSDCGAA